MIRHLRGQHLLFDCKLMFPILTNSLPIIYFAYGWVLCDSFWQDQHNPKSGPPFSYVWCQSRYYQTCRVRRGKYHQGI